MSSCYCTTIVLAGCDAPAVDSINPTRNSSISSNTRRSSANRPSSPNEHLYRIEALNAAARMNPTRAPRCKLTGSEEISYGPYYGGGVMSRSLPHSSIERASRELEETDGERTRTTGINIRESPSETKPGGGSRSIRIMSQAFGLFLRLASISAHH